MPVLLLGEEEDAGGALDGGRLEAGGADAHHGAAQDDLAGRLHKAAALLGQIAEGGAHPGQGVHGVLQGAAGDGDDTLDDGLALVAGLINGVAGTGGDHVCAHAGGQPAGLDLTAGDGLDLHLLAALGVLDLLGHDLDAVLLRMEGVEQIDGVLLVDLDPVVGLLHAAGDAHELDAAEQLLGEIEHGEMVAVQVRLALGAVDDELVHLADTALDLEGGGEHGAAHADNAGLADALKYRVGVLELLFRQRLHKGGGVQPVVFNDDGGDHVSQGMGPGLHRHHLAGDGGVDRSGDRRGVFADLLSHLHKIALLDQGLAGSADMLDEGDHNLLRRRDDRDGNIRPFHIVGVHAAMERVGHKLHLV